MGLNIKGKKFNIPNVGITTLYPVSKLSQAMADTRVPRDPQTLRLWIKSGILPRPLFFNPGDVGKPNPKSLWTQEQIDLVVRTAKECGIRQGEKAGIMEFKTLIHSRMLKLNREKYLQG